MMFRFWRRARVADEAVHPVWQGFSQPGTRGVFAEAVARWSIGEPGGGRDTVMLACDLLVEGVDTPSLRDLASLPLDAGWLDSRDVLKSTVEEIGLEFFDRGCEAAYVVVLRYLCRVFLEGSMAEREFVLKVHDLFGGEPPAVAHDLVRLGYAFDEVEVALGWWGDTTGLAEKYAREFLAATA